MLCFKQKSFSILVLAICLVITSAVAQTDQVVTVNGVSFKMIYVKGGTFEMGTEYGEEDESPVHSVTVSDFYIGETEVTQALWKAVMGESASYFRGDQLPMEGISWNDCQEFVKKLNQLTGKKFMLPTEAQWEFAARGGQKSKSYLYAGSNDIEKVAWYWKNSGKSHINESDQSWAADKIMYNDGQTHEVKSKLPNELGLYDMSGNVWEWCQDLYGNYEETGQNIPKDPKGAKIGDARVLRGGSWYFYAQHCRITNRNGNNPEYRYFHIGLRLVLAKP